MKTIFITATMVGAAIAGVILYMKGNSGRKRLNGAAFPIDKRVDGQVRHMKYSMG
jgi:hypothetical protein